MHREFGRALGYTFVGVDVLDDLRRHKEHIVGACIARPRATAYFGFAEIGIARETGHALGDGLREKMKSARSVRRGRWFL